MAEIEIVYREGHCVYNGKEYCDQCHTCTAEDMGCEYFHQEKKPNVIPFGDCDRARFDYIYKGWAGKHYEMEEFRDPYNPQLDCMVVTMGRKAYDCVKVTLNGKCIFNVYDEEGENENAE